MNVGIDPFYPLPLKDLHTRYDPVFSGFKRGLSSTLIGLPENHRSSFLKFILNYDSQILRTFIEPSYRFIMIDESLSSAEHLVRLISYKFLELNTLPDEDKSELQSMLSSNDSLFTLIILEKMIKKLSKIKIVIVLYNLDEMITKDQTIIDILAKIWNVGRTPPEPIIHFCFIGSPILLEDMHTTRWSHLVGALEENICYFSTFNKEETNYMRKRFEVLWDKKINQKGHDVAFELSGGHGVLYRSLINLLPEDLAIAYKEKWHASISGVAERVWNSLSLNLKQNICSGKTLDSLSGFEKTIASEILNIQVLPPKLKRQNTNLPDDILLTAQQKLVLEYLKSQSDKVIARDELAQTMWGKLWEKKYSDWAIDKCINDLKKKLQGTKIDIITIRNRGFKYIIYA